MSTPLHIGIVGCSAEGAALCYRTICTEGAQRLGGHAHPPVSMHTPSLADYTACLERSDWDGVAALMLDSARRLAAIGAEVLVCPDNTIHAAFERVAPHAPRPWLHIAEVVAEEAARRGFRCCGVLGTRWLVASEVYPAALAARGIAAIRPTADDAEQVSAVIMDELVPGRIVPASTARLQVVIERLKQAGADAVVLGCTELPLVLDDGNSALPTLDSTRLLARAALDRALAA